MIPPIDITADTRDITRLWRRITGVPVDGATAHLRGGRIITVTLGGRRPLAMCRAGACALLYAQTVAAVEARDHGRLH